MSIVYLSREMVGAFRPMFPDANILKKKGRIGLGAVDDNKPVGVAIFEIENATAHLKWIYVAPDYRGKGIGGELLKYFVDISKKVPILFLYFIYQLDDKATAFFQKEGFVIEQEFIYRIFRDDIADNKILSHIHIKNAKILPIASMNIDDYSFVQRFINENMYGEKISISENVCKEASFLSFKESGEIDACIITSLYEGTLCIDLLYSLANSEKKILYLLAVLREYVIGNNIDNVIFYCANYKVIETAQTLFPGRVIKDRGHLCGTLYIE